MRLLVIGGTSFVGRHFVEAALAAGHTVTLFNRGKTAPELFPEAEKLVGDRTKDVEVLKGREWDAVLDTSGYTPRVVRMSAEALAGSAGFYAFISTISVYEGFPSPGQTEDAPLAELADPTVEDVTGETYGGLKVLCEQAVQEIFDGKNVIIRPGIIVGPHDPTDRFTYLIARAAKGGEMLVPGSLNAPLQFIDARDLGAWTLHMIEDAVTGIYNAVGPKVTLADVLTTARDQEAADTQFVSVDGSFLSEHDTNPNAVNAFFQDGDDSFVWDVDAEKAIAQGLTLRSPAVTIADTLAWESSRPADHPWRAGLNWTKEAGLLAAWHEQAAPVAK